MPQPQYTDSILFAKKMRRVCKWVKREYGLKSMREITDTIGEQPMFLRNVCRRRPLYDVMRGPQLHRIYNFCKTFGINMEYFADPNIPVNGSFLAEVPDINYLETKYITSGNLLYFQMAAGLVLGRLNEACQCAMRCHVGRATVTVLEGPKAGMCLVIDCVPTKGFFYCTVTGAGQAPQTNTRLTDSLCNGIVASLKNLLKIDDTVTQ